MALFETSINIQSDGVYRPLNPRLGAIAGTAIFCYVTSQFYLGKMPLYAAIFIAVLTAAIFLFTKIKYGKTGVPYVKLSANELTLFLYADSRRKMCFPLDNLREIQIYGRAKEHKYRFIRYDGTFVELTPYLDQQADQGVIQFLTTRFPSNIEVKLCEAQSFFEVVRGDGP